MIDKEEERLLGKSTNFYNKKSFHQRLFDILFWCWLNPILKKGYKNQLNNEDLDELSNEDQCSILYRKFLIYDYSKRKLWFIVFDAFRKETIYIGLILIPQIISRLCQPIFLCLIINEISLKENNIKKHIALCISLYLVTIIQAFTYQHYFFYSKRLGLRIRNGISLIIYKNLLSINLSSLQQIESSQIINLISNDAGKFEEFWQYGHFLWGAPLEVLLTFLTLSFIIGILPTIISFIVLLLFIPLQLIFSKYFNKLHEKTMINSDKRIQMSNELFHNCHIIKMYNWEKSMEKKLNQIRYNELKTIKYSNYLRAFNLGLYFLLPCFVSFITFLTIWYLGYQLKANEIFTSIAFFSQIRLPLANYLPIAIEKLSKMRVASNRIEKFMKLKSKQLKKMNSKTNPNGTIIMNNAFFSWKNKNDLSSINLNIKSGELIGIIGSVGSGKSSLFSAILGEMNLIEGNLSVNGKLSYVMQSPWIFADTIRSNIILEKEFNKERYENIIQSCCLDVDFHLFGSTGDLTIIGENGINLSGGQKARISLARALYYDADIYLLDDPLSAVDINVAKIIFDKCIGPESLLKNKTRLLITHQRHFLKLSDQCFNLSNGFIEKITLSNDLLLNINQSFNNKQDINIEQLDVNKSILDTKSILSDEILLTGHINWSLLYHLLTSPPFGLFGLIILIILLISGELFYDITIYWLSYISQKSYEIQQENVSFISIYLILTLFTIIIGLSRVLFWFYIMLCGSINKHNQMIKNLLYTSLRFFESNSIGRIINRISRDQYVIDELFPLALFDGIQALLILIGSIIIMILINPFISILLIFLISSCYYLYFYYLNTNRQLKSMENITRSPVYSLFSSTLNGLSTIRTFKIQKNFFEKFTKSIDSNTRISIYLLAEICWFGIRLDFLGSLFVLFNALLCINLNNTLPVAIQAFSLTCSLNILSRLQWSMRQIAESENLMISAERINEYTKLLPEEDNKDLIQIPIDWPKYGNIQFKNYTFRYRSQLEPVLNHINIFINSNEKIGIVGRTGAGKSSLFQALFRFVERSLINGEIYIDNIDISQIKLEDLRSNLSIIPQIPVLFSGTIRYNLDPFEIYTDEECCNALESVQLKHRICDHPNGLYLLVSESGNNFSVGERQLICLARAILKKTKILLIDEATANVDLETDVLIQKIIREKFHQCTILTIAHRLNTITESDKILVLEKVQVIGCCLPRTGTNSLTEALNILQFGPTYHLYEIPASKNSRDHIKFWISVEDKIQSNKEKEIKWNKFFENEGNYKSAVTTPACFYYKQLADYYPNSKIIVTIRDNAKTWYESMKATVLPCYLRRSTIILSKIYWFDYWMHYYVRPKLFQPFGGINNFINNSDYACEMYYEYIKSIKEHFSNEPQRLLIFNVKDGWKPLCDFLNVPIPLNCPFPHENTREKYWESKLQNASTKRMNYLMIFMIFFIFILLFCFYFI